METSEKAFWDAYVAVGREVLEQGKKMGFGQSIIDVKFHDGQPAVLIRSIALTTKYPDNQAAKINLAKEIEDAEKGKFDGSRTYTVVWNKGRISRVLLDEYSNHLLQ